MKRWAIPSLAALAIGVLALTMSAAPARADAIDFNFQNGSITSTAAGVVTGTVTSTSSSNTLSVARNISPNTSLGPFFFAGTFTFTTGSFSGGTGTQANPFTWGPGGSVSVTTGGSAQTINGVSVAAGTALFTGSFSGTETATFNDSIAVLVGPFVLGSVNSNLLTALGMGSQTTFRGSLSANLAITGFSANGLPTAANLSSGDLTISNTPEPGTLALFGSGLLGIAGLARRYMLKSNS